MLLKIALENIIGYTYRKAYSVLIENTMSTDTTSRHLFPISETFNCRQEHSSLSDCFNPSGVTSNLVNYHCTSSNVLEIQCTRKG